MSAGAQVRAFSEPSCYSDRLDWADKVFRVLACAYFPGRGSQTIEVCPERDRVRLFAGPLIVGDGSSLTAALQDALTALSQADLLAAMQRAGIV